MAYNSRNRGNVPLHNHKPGNGDPEGYHQGGHPEGHNNGGNLAGYRDGGHRAGYQHGGSPAGHQYGASTTGHQHGGHPKGHKQGVNTTGSRHGSHPQDHHQGGRGYRGHSGGYHHGGHSGKPQPGGYSAGHHSGSHPSGNYHGGYPAVQYHEGNGDWEMHDHEMQTQAQEQIQKQRSLQASAQMLYDGYEHTMGMIEELEKHEGHNTSAGFSGLLTHIIPKGTKKPKHDVTAIIEAELTCLDAQMTFAPPEVTRAARMKLLEKTLKWAAAREEAKIKPSSVDAYTKNVVQVLIKPDSVKFPERERDPRSASLDECTVNELIFGFAQAQHKGDLQDKEFEADPNKKAAMRKIREGEDLHSGAVRLVDLNPQDREFYHVLDASLKHLDSYAKGDLC